MTNETELIDSANTPWEVFNAVNTASNNVLGLSIVITSLLIGILMLLARGRSLEEVFIYMGGLEFIIVLLLALLQWLPISWIFLPIGLLLAGIILSMIK